MENKSVQYWLFFCAFMVFAMAVIGAITRLTESGLSMVEWRPLVGTLPPLSQAEWERVFALYQETPEYRQKNFWMGIEDFKYIFFWEWFHRFWGRLIGLVYALPLAWFWIKNMIPQGYKPKLLIALVLGGLQGLMGWYMVVSGLADRPSVSHYRLAAHLSLAFIIFAHLLWMAFDLRLDDKHSRDVPRGSGDLKEMGTKDSRWSLSRTLIRDGKSKNERFCLKRHGWITMGVLSITIIWGAFVAGLDGGLIYNTWPHMGSHMGMGTLIPAEVSSLASLYENPAAVQFFHRWIAILAAIIAFTFAWRMKSIALAGAVFLQVGIGIATLLSQVWIPLAALHQAGALVIIAIMIYHLQRLHAAPKSPPLP